MTTNTTKPMADSKNTDHGKAREYAETWPTTVASEMTNLARCYLEREAMLGECREVLGYYQRLLNDMIGPDSDAPSQVRLRACLSRLSERKA